MNNNTNYVKQKNCGSSLPDFAFLCTLCWQYQSYGTKPKILGESARIICEKCWRRMINLSICWACGDIVVCGDEAVSLGLCFWHYSCFGCLICGTQISLPKDEIPFKVNSDNFTENLYHSGRRLIELQSVPLCHVCEIETTEGERKDQVVERKDQVVERGLATVSMFDGGLSRQRFEYLEVGKDQGSTFATPIRRKLKSRSNTSSTSTDLNIQLSSGSADEISPLLGNAAHLSISNIEDSVSVDEAEAKESSPSTSDLGSETLGSSIYLSIFDPLDDIAFTPRTTKPLPRWMNLYPKDLGVIKKRKTNLVPGRISPSSEEAEVFFSNTTTKPNSNLDDIA